MIREMVNGKEINNMAFLFIAQISNIFSPVLAQVALDGFYQVKFE
jgi:hypothetical protein